MLEGYRSVHRLAITQRVREVYLFRRRCKQETDPCLALSGPVDDQGACTIFFTLRCILVIVLLILWSFFICCVLTIRRFCAGSAASKVVLGQLPPWEMKFFDRDQSGCLKGTRGRWSEAGRDCVSVGDANRPAATAAIHHEEHTGF